MSKHYYNCRPYKNAVPCCEFIEHAPTDAQMDALQEAKRLAEKDARKNGQYGWGKVSVRDGSGCYAAVQWSPGHCSSSIWYRNPASSGGMCFIKQWSGVPEWEDTGMSKGRVDIRAPEQQVHYVYENIDIVHQRRFRHVNAPDQHSYHGAPPENVQIATQQTQVNVHQSGRAIERHHEAPQTLISALFFGVRKQPQQAQQAALPAPQAINRGALLPAPQQPQQRQPQPLAIARQPGIPMEAPKKKAGFWS